MKNIICNMFGHNFFISSNWDEMWAACKRCGHTQDIPKEREEEAYEKIRNKDYKIYLL